MHHLGGAGIRHMLVADHHCIRRIPRIAATILHLSQHMLTLCCCLMQLPYLDAVFRETLRLCPPASLGASYLLQVIMLRNACQHDMTACFT